MKRKTLIKIHIAATLVAILTIGSFLTASLVAELSGSETVIKNIKEAILFALPLLLVAMPAVALSGNKLAGKSNHPIVLAKQKRMRFITLNGLCLIGLAFFLYYRSHYQAIDGIFFITQIAEFGLGLTNLVLLGLNSRSGVQLSGRFKRMKPLGVGSQTSI
ncbi:hypothetical protein [Spirosoma validum]|uniref:Uncharacterized protein n=1 Tax=Spirosoma validum TaxID=2771355 RepID=A0A927B936_9BACT|nr:hypothetical protein [Spirosoma validum]MBD2757456.1 hypothetical protein [Spirosoma validum]